VRHAYEFTARENASDNSQSKGITLLVASPARRIGHVLLVAALAAAPLAARAQVYKCVQPNGTIAFQSTPCSATDRPSTRPTAAQLNAQRGASTKDVKPYDDPYASGSTTRPSSPAPALHTPPSTDEVAQAQKTSNLVADVQARNHRENQQQAYQEAHKNDKMVDMAACNGARHDLGILNEQRPVFSYDDKGNRVFVEDKDRASRIAEAQKLISASCP